MLTNRSAPLVGKRWASNFVKREPELRTRSFRSYDCKRAKCENPEVIRGWFALVENTISKYGIDASGIYNCDETGFMMGVISTAMVATSTERSPNEKLAQSVNREWYPVIQSINSQSWWLPPFIVVASQYQGGYGVHHQGGFFEAFFLAAFEDYMIEKNIRGGAGLVPLNPKSLISKPDVKLRTTTPVTGIDELPVPWVSKAPNNRLETSSRYEFIKDRISRHQKNSPTSTLYAVDQFDEGA